MRVWGLEMKGLRGLSVGFGNKGCWAWGLDIKGVWVWGLGIKGVGEGFGNEGIWE